MFKLLANAAAAASLVLGVCAASPALASGKRHTANCPHSKAKQAKLAKRATVKAPPARGVTVIDKRKLDVQILSFGP